MAILWYEHFDLYGTAIADLAARGYGPCQGAFVTPGRTGSLAWGSGGGFSDVALIRVADAPLNNCGQAVAFNSAIANNGSGGGSANPGLRFRVGTDNGAIRVVPNVNLGVSVFQGATLLGSTPNNLYTVGAWHHLEALVVSGAGTGSVQVRVNGTLHLTLSNLTIGQITGYGIARDFSSGIEQVLWDDWVVWDTSGTVNNSFLGDTFVIVAAPDADSTPSDWVPDTGTTRFSRVNEASPADASFITGNAVGDAQEFTHVQPNLPTGAVAAIATQTRALKTDSGSSGIEIGLSSNGATSMRAEAALSTTALVYSHIANLNPNGNVPWTQSAAQAARMRVRRSS